MIGYMSFAEMSENVRAGSHRVSRDVDLIVGIPRSGMIPAYLLGLYRNLPVVDLPTFIKGGNPENGGRNMQSDSRTIHDARNILLVDDSILSGSSMRTGVNRIREAGFSGEVTTCAVVVEPSRTEYVDLSFCAMPTPRFFEWNAFHHSYIVESACMDMDGVICVDPNPEDNDDGPRYRNFLETAALKCRPTGHIGYIVSSRLGKYRCATESWLSRNRIDYGELILLEGATAKERNKLRLHAPFKARIYTEKNSPIFFESDAKQAEEIAKLSGKPVLCVESMQMDYPPLRSWPLRQVVKWKLAEPIGRIKAWRRRFAH
jgi:uncharacterized HAD superfamily protein/adenine/guanine phosphoribosyltransferase-like PRPP-binding protein